MAITKNFWVALNIYISVSIKDNINEPRDNRDRQICEDGEGEVWVVGGIELSERKL